jgi:hypothetical protein
MEFCGKRYQYRTVWAVLLSPIYDEAKAAPDASSALSVADHCYRHVVTLIRYNVAHLEAAEMLPHSIPNRQIDCPGCMGAVSAFPLMASVAVIRCYLIGCLFAMRNTKVRRGSTPGICIAGEIIGREMIFDFRDKDI